LRWRFGTSDIERLKDEELKLRLKTQSLELESKNKEIEDLLKSMKELEAKAGGGGPSKKEALLESA
jgi:hypothetical protein